MVLKDDLVSNELCYMPCDFDLLLMFLIAWTSVPSHNLSTWLPKLGTLESCKCFIYIPIIVGTVSGTINLG